MLDIIIFVLILERWLWIQRARNTAIATAMTCGLVVSVRGSWDVARNAESIAGYRVGRSVLNESEG
jgi:hypothetical protein